MARERSASTIPLTENTLFVGPRIPDEIRRMTPHLTSIDKALFRKILQVIVVVLEGKAPDDGLLQRLQSDTVTEDTLSCLYAGLYSLLRSALRLPQTSLKPEQFKADLVELNALNRVLEPSVLMELNLSDGKIHAFEVSSAKFHELRYNVAYMLKEMEDVEKKNILKIQD
ncbi:regulation of RNA metabolic process [Desmophyllum pertusum]|uniref:COMM domain-containing protein 5 n=1 Tax=Desmophyllum pertusum TaxID=174260 RepID=A0A9W9Y950_9CNID|nr:regulation of RNA metabolic process [Desmophyllum pertusum]